MAVRARRPLNRSSLAGRRIMNKGRKIALMAAAPGVIAFLFMLSAASRGAWGEYGHPIWLINYVFALYVLAAIIGLPVYYWWKDRSRRK